MVSYFDLSDINNAFGQINYEHNQINNALGLFNNISGHKEINTIKKLLISKPLNTNAIQSNLYKLMNKNRNYNFTMNDLFNLSLLTNVTSCHINKKHDHLKNTVVISPIVDVFIEGYVDLRLFRYVELYGDIDDFDEIDIQKFNEIDIDEC